jgi:hypothetical protein
MLVLHLQKNTGQLIKLQLFLRSEFQCINNFIHELRVFKNPRIICKKTNLQLLIRLPSHRLYKLKIGFINQL